MRSTCGCESQVKVLLVDDYPENLIALEAMLQSPGLSLVKARSGKEALRYLLEEDFAVILLDVSMPEMNGFETAQLIRQRPRSRHTPIIFLSAACDNHLLSERGYALGAVDCLSKPINPEILIAKVAVFVELFRKNLEVQQQARQLVNQQLEIFRIQAARQQAEAANRMKDEFIAVVSHELRTPLNAILGWSQLLIGGKLSSERTQQAIQTIERNARMQAQLIGDILEMTKLTQGKLHLSLQSLNLNDLLASLVESMQPLAEPKGLRLQSQLDPLPRWVNADPVRLRQIFWNLLTNAIKFTPAGGEIWVKLETGGTAALSSLTTDSIPASFVKISITDTGIGISPEFLPHVFDRFRQADGSATRAQGGLGLGLAIVRQLVELHQGRIEVFSQGRGQGTTFTLHLPLDTTVQPQPIAPPPPVAIPAPVHPCNPTMFPLAAVQVLVVEDHPDSRTMLQSLLEEAGASVVTASSAAEAIEILQDVQPNVLVSDIAMPGSDGYGLIRQVRAWESQGGGHIPAIALSAYAKPEDQTQSLLAGFEIHLAKPVDATVLISAIAQLCQPVPSLSPPPEAWQASMEGLPMVTRESPG
uniref:Circadian input-output histidine kinase CikA n=1 Tax=Cyanothece sp. (strain PCC 7425 / ATCC 29141) TaxID=395961 RepID=B8HTK5_CYAP4